VPEPIVADTSQRFIRFYSKRTLEDVHVLVKELDDGLAVYVNKDGTLGTIGRRGVRMPDGSPGLVIHVAVQIAADGSAQIVPANLIEKSFYSLDLAPVGADELLALLLGTLTEAGLVVANAKPRTGPHHDRGRRCNPQTTDES
jgi:hypothetical protein